MKKKYNLINFKIVKSTNLEIKKFIKLKKKIDNLCISAENQTNGYGRRKTKWFSYKGNIHLSIFLKPKCFLEQINQLSFIASVSVGEVLRKIKKNIIINYKWPNDVLLNCKKISGIIIETSSNSKNNIKWAIVGIGVNLKKYPKLNNKNFHATSLSNEKIFIEKEVFLDYFLEIFFKYYELWKKKGFNIIKKKWISNIYKKKNNIYIQSNKGLINGKFIGLEDNGSIRLQKQNKIMKIHFGDQILR